MSMVNKIRCSAPPNLHPHPHQNQLSLARPPSAPALPTVAADRVTVSLAARGIDQSAATHNIAASKADNRAASEAAIAIEKNTEIDAYVAATAIDLFSPTQEASMLVKQMFKEKWGRDIDPDNTFLTTLKYLDVGSGQVKPGEIIRSISLTQALLSNAQEQAEGEGTWQRFDKKGGPTFSLVKQLPTMGDALTKLPALLAPLFKLALHANPLLSVQPGVRTYEAMYCSDARAGDGAVDTPDYNPSTQLDVAPQAFRDALWKMDPGKTYQNYLDRFWQQHEAAYPLLAKIAYVQASQMQFQEGSLSAEGHALAARVAGLRGEQQWQTLTLNDLGKSRLPDPELHVGLLDIHGYQATDVLYATDQKNQKTLLYIPGNSSPLHEFKNPDAMKNWLAHQARDDNKRAALLSHFTLADRPDGYSWAGVDEALQGLAAWPRVRHASGGLLSFNRATFSGYWDPQTYINQHAKLSVDPFSGIAHNQKTRSYADAALLVTSDRDVRKAEASRYLEAAAMVLAPLALLIPGAGVAVDAALLTIGGAEIGIGVDDIAHGKTALGQRRIAFGVLNAMPVLPLAAAAKSLAKTEQLMGHDVVAGINRADHATSGTTEPISSTPPWSSDPANAAALDTRLTPYVSNQRSTGLGTDAQGMYQIDRRSYAAIGDKLFHIQKNTQGPGYRVLADGEVAAAFNAPLLRRRPDGIWEPAPAAGLRGGGNADGKETPSTDMTSLDSNDGDGTRTSDTTSLDSSATFASFSTAASSSAKDTPIPRAPLAQAESNANSLNSYYAELGRSADVRSSKNAASVNEVFEAPIAASSSSRTGRKASAALLPPPIRAGLTPEIMQAEAKEIFSEVRALYKKGPKSGNKVRLSGTGAGIQLIEEDAVRQIQATEFLGKFIRHPDRVSDIAAAERLGAGNCYEMARSVIWRAQQKGLPASLGHIAEDGDHFFAIIGARLPDRVRHIEELSQAWIADPWAGIFAPAAEYENRFVAKMNKWTENNKIISFQHTWMYPNDPRWLNSVIGKFKAIEHVPYTPVVPALSTEASAGFSRSCMGSFC